MKKNILLISFAIFIISCGDKKNDDIVQEPNKDGAIETVVSVKHGKGFDVLTTVHKVWIKNKLDKTLTKIDTLKSLGTTLEEGENNNGDAEKVALPKDYEFYITVK